MAAGAGRDDEDSQLDRERGARGRGRPGAERLLRWPRRARRRADGRAALRGPAPCRVSARRAARCGSTPGRRRGCAASARGRGRVEQLQQRNLAVRARSAPRTGAGRRQVRRRGRRRVQPQQRLDRPRALGGDAPCRRSPVSSRARSVWNTGCSDGAIDAGRVHDRGQARRRLRPPVPGRTRASSPTTPSTAAAVSGRARRSRSAAGRRSRQAGDPGFQVGAAAALLPKLGEQRLDLEDRAAGLLAHSGPQVGVGIGRAASIRASRAGRVALTETAGRRRAESAVVLVHHRVAAPGAPTREPPGPLPRPASRPRPHPMSGRVRSRRPSPRRGWSRRPGGQRHCRRRRRTASAGCSSGSGTARGSSRRGPCPCPWWSPLQRREEVRAADRERAD